MTLPVQGVGISVLELGPADLSIPFILARILEGGDVGNHLNEFRSLSRETDPELFYEGLYHLGVRLEQSGQVGVAASVYSFLANGNGETANRRNGELNPSPIPRFTVSPILQQQAQERLAALRGEGSVGLRLEVLSRTFARQAMAPAPLIGMGVAGLAFRGMNLFAATRLASMSAGFLTRGPGLRIFSGLVGFAAEVPAFTLTGRAVDRLLMGDVGAHGRAPLLQEMASGALVLGSLKLFGLGFGQLGERLNVGARHAVPVQQMGMLTGIMAGHGLEVAFGLRERQNASNFLAESLVTLAQFNVAGRLSNSVFGERYERLQRSLAMQAEAVGKVRGSEFGVRSRVKRIIEQLWDGLNGPPLAGATVGGGGDGRSYMVGEGGEGGEGGGSGKGSGTSGSHLLTQPFHLRAADLPVLFQSIHEAFRQISSPDLKFGERLASGDVIIHIQEDVAEETYRGFPPTFGEHLTVVSSRQEVPVRRRVLLKIANRDAVIFVKREEGFQIHTGSWEEANPEPPSYRERLETLSFVEQEGEGRDPRIGSFSIELLNRVRDPQYQFAESLQKEDVELTLKSEGGFNQERFLRLLLPELNKLPEIPDGRRVSILLAQSQRRIVLVKAEEGFKEEGAEEIPTPPNSTLIEEVLPPTSRPFGIPSRMIPLVSTSAERLPLLLRVAYQNRFEGEEPRAIIIEARKRGAPLTSDVEVEVEVNASLLEQLSGHLGGDFANEVTFEVMVASDHRSFLGKVQGEILQWVEGRAHPWTSAALRAMRPEMEIQSATELYQVLEAISRDNLRSPEAELRIHFKGATPEAPDGNFGNFVLKTLNSYQVQGKRITLQFDTGEPTIIFAGKDGLWNFTGEISEREPPSAADHFARARAALQPPPPEEEAPPSDAVSAARLFVLARMRLEAKAMAPRVPSTTSGPALLTSFSDVLDFMKTAADSTHNLPRIEAWLELFQPMANAFHNRIIAQLRGLPLGRVVILHEGQTRKTHIFQRRGRSVQGREREWIPFLAVQDSSKSGVPVPSLEASEPVDLLKQLSFLRGLGGPAQIRLLVSLKGEWQEQGNAALLSQYLACWTDFPFTEIELNYPPQKGSPASTGTTQILKRGGGGVWSVE